MGLAVIEMITFHQPCIVCRTPARLCHKEGTHSEFWDPSQALAVARQLNGEQRQFVTFSLSHSLSCWRLDGSSRVTERGQPAEKKGRQEQRLAGLQFQTLELGFQILLHRTPQNWLSEEREVASMQSDKLFFRAGGRRKKEMICP